jgi:NADH-quinone oxidoreductase subunit C
MTDPQDLRDALFSLAARRRGGFTLSEGRCGRITAWLALADKDDLRSAAADLKAIGARLSMVTAMAGAEPGTGEVAYHFDIEGSTLTVKVSVAAGGSVDTLVPLFRNADWHEREFMELYDIEVAGRTDNRRLFLDESVAGQVMDRLIPLSVLSNAASTNMLFEKLLTSRETR